MELSIDREKAIRGLEDIVDFFEVMSVIENRCNELKQEAEDAIALLKEKDAVVRCKDCKHRSYEMYDYYGNPNNKVYVCQIHDLAKKPDWFCADGERRRSE